jgi:hypothetical protein
MGLMHVIVAVLLASAGWTQASAQAIYTCVDSKGRRITADRPIADCTDREQKELNPSGTVKRKVAPNLTPPERAAEEERARVAGLERARAEEERKREKALVERYPDRASHDRERAAALEPVEGTAKAAEARAAELATQRKRFDSEVDFYRRDPTKYPPVLRRQLEENEQQIAVQKRMLAGQAEERKRINARFDEELAQLRRLWAAKGAPQASK